MCQAFLLQLLVVDVVSCERDDVGLLGLVEAADLLDFRCGLEAIHHGHAAVHEDHAILGAFADPIFLLNALLDPFNCLFAIRNGFRFQLELYFYQGL